MNRDKTYIQLWLFGAFLMPPMVWLLLAWFAEIWSFSEMFQIVLYPVIWIYVVVYLAFVAIGIRWKLATIQKWFLDPSEEKLVRAQKQISSLVMFFSVNVILYLLIGPKVVTYHVDFLTEREFWLAEATGLPIIFLFATPFFIQYLKNIELWTKPIPLSRKYPFISLKNKMAMTLGFTTVGVIFLISLFSISIINAHAGDSGEQIFHRLLIKDLVASVISISIMFLNLFLIIGSVNRPVSQINQMLNTMLKNIGEGQADLTVNIDVESRNEIGIFTRKLNEFVLILRTMINIIKTNANSLSRASDNLMQVSTNLSESSETMITEAQSVASATEEMSMNMNTVASTTEEMSVNIASVATAAEQMSQNMNNISRTAEGMTRNMDSISKNSENSSHISGIAVNYTKNASTSMDTLGLAAEEIGEVTNVIKRIAEKTNLLALNATIEAASAGEAGKGFGVVAFEIKELANQSATAAEDIAKKINDVQKNTRNAVEVIREVSEIVAKLNHASQSINDSVLGQTSSMESISINIAEANKGIGNIAKSAQELTIGANDLSKNAGEAARGTENVSQSMSSVNGKINQNKDISKKVNSSAHELFNISEDLRKTVGQFIVDREEQKRINPNSFEKDMAEIDFFISNHINRGKALSEMLKTGIAFSPTSHEECILGKWYTGEGKIKYGKLEEFKGIGVPHRKLHEIVLQIHTLFQENRKDEASRLMPHWEELSRNLTQRLNELKRAIRKLGEKNV